MIYTILKKVGIWGYLTFGVLALLFVVGESIETPGATNPYALIALWLFPLVLVLVLVLKKVSYLRLL